MPDCPNAEIRDLLPDLAAGRLPGDLRVRAEAHLATCAECRDELAVLRAVRAARPAPRVGVRAIVAALPTAPAGPEAGPAVVSLAERREAKAGGRRGAASPSWRRAAAIAAIVLGGGVSYGVLRDAGRVPVTRESPAPDSPVAIVPLVVPARGGGPARAEESGLSLGGVVAGLSAAEMEALLADLEAFDGVPRVDPGVEVALIEESGA